MGLDLEIFPYQEIKSPCSLCGLPALCGNIFPCFWLSVSSFVLLKHVCQWPLGIPSASFSISDSTGERVRSLCCSMRRVPVGKLPHICYSERPTIKPSITLSLLYVSKGLFHPMLDCLVSSLRSLLPDAVCRSVWRPLLGLVTSTWCSVGHLQTKAS